MGDYPGCVELEINVSVGVKVCLQTLTVVPEGEDGGPGITNRRLDLTWSVLPTTSNIGIRLEICFTLSKIFNIIILA